MKPAWRALILPALAAMVFPGISADAGISGRLRHEGDKPLARAFVGLFSSDWTMVETGATDTAGAFSIDGDTEGGFLAVQPLAKENSDGLGIYRAFPRIYALRSAQEVDLKLPDGGCLVLKAYDRHGALMRWEDFERMGKMGGQFVYATNLDDQIRPASIWPVYDETAREAGSPREKGLPTVVIPPGEAYAVQVLFWETARYGKLLLRADNQGKGYHIKSPGDAHVLELNVELARTALADLERRQGHFSSNSQTAITDVKARLAEAIGEADPIKRAAGADAVLASALDLRDRFELAAAKAAIPKVRQGELTVRVESANGQGVPKCEVRITQHSHDFLFGVFEGSPYNARSFEAARDAGFELATVLPAWGWSDVGARAVSLRDLDRQLGISALAALGYRVKAHGVVWLQEYGILPGRAFAMSHEQVRQAAVEQLRGLLRAYSDRITLWEAMNEPAATNVLAMPRPMLNALLGESAHAIKGVPGMTSLVNSGHEVDYGRKYVIYGLDNKPLPEFNLSYLEALERADADGAMRDVDVVGIQFYPGYRFNAMFGGLQGPCMTPSWLVDTVGRYTRFGKPIHITEFSLPSSYEDDWYAGYWREPWNEQTQADYAEAAFTIAFGHPNVQSISWWDVTDLKPSVVTGGLIDASGQPKPAFERIKALMAAWTTDATAKTGDSGAVTLRGFGGGYRVEATLPNGDTIKGQAHIQERDVATVTLKAAK
jgi:hypothetical protein